MCGIAGIVGRVGEPNMAALSRMHNALRHRGPDDEGTWVSPPDTDGFGCMLSHRRLSILDLTPRGHQPMLDPVGGQALTLNGEIYNYKDLRDELIASSERFGSTGDTAVILRAMALWGAQRAIPRFRGMFAFGLWDSGSRRLVLARDPLGIKPLYFCRNSESEGAWSLAFASEVRALLASGLIKPALDPQAVFSVVWNGFVVGPGTAVRGVQSISPGEFAEFDDRGRLIRRQYYWSFSSCHCNHGSTAVNEQEVTRAVEESVRLHLISDVPVGVFLSGGVDSSAVANLAQRQSDSPIRTFTLTFEEPLYDEGPHARRIAQALGTIHQDVVLTEQRFLSTINAAMKSLDQPTFDGLNSYFVSQAVREAGIAVALSGTGGDELFGGYTSFSRLSRLLRLLGRDAIGLEPLRAMLSRAASAVATVAGWGHGQPIGSQSGWMKLPHILGCVPDLIAMYQLAYTLFLPRFQRELLSDECAAAGSADGLSDPLRERLSRELAGHHPLAAISILEQRIFLGERLLRDTDAASMSVALETRLPLVDYKLSAVLDRMNERTRFQPLGRKSLLKKIGLRGLDQCAFTRPKSGFVLPFDAWIRRGLSAPLAELLLDARVVKAVGLRPQGVARLWAAFNDSSNRIYWSRLWAIYALVRWCHDNNVFL